MRGVSDMALKVFLTSIAVWFLLKAIYRFTFDPIQAMRHSYFDENPRFAVIGLLIFLDVAVMFVSGVFCVWSYF